MTSVSTLISGIVGLKAEQYSILLIIIGVILIDISETLRIKI